MAVSKLVGEIDGEEIIFRRSGDNTWCATVPSNVSGEYVVEVKAYDEAGNKAYHSKMLFIVNPSNLEVNILPVRFAYTVESDRKYSEELKKSDFVYREVGSEFIHKNKTPNFTARVVD